MRGSATLSGQIIAHYRVLERLGQGGMGVVYRAEDVRLHRQVALKFLSESVAEDAQALARFQREAQASSSLNHPNVCTVYDIGQERDLTFIAMELLEGRSLRQILSSNPMRVDEVLDIGSQVADGLAAAHKRGIIHRDIKPENIFITTEGNAKILDFGLAKIAEDEKAGASTTLSATRPGALLGTVAYMSPEQARALGLDERTDLFSLGAVLYELATGHLPFRGESTATILRSILDSDPVPAKRLNPDVPDRLEEIINKCLEKDRKLRYQHASELSTDLKRLRREPQQGSISASTVGPARLTRKRTVARVAVALTVLLAMVFGAYRQFWHSRPTKKTAARAMLAVLPFTDLSQENGEAYFADGLTEEMIAQLGQLQPAQLGVIARTSSMQYKNTHRTAEQIGHELGVNYLLEGSVRRAGDSVRITAQLIQTADQTHLWAESYDRKLSDVLNVQREIAERVTRSLRLELLPQAASRGATKGQLDPEAHRKYLVALNESNKGTREGGEKAIAYLKEAIAIEPKNADLYAALAKTYVALHTYYRSPSDVMPQAKQAALRALELDPDQASAHVQLGDIYLSFDWDWEAAEAEYRKALAINPSLPEAQMGYADYLATLGRFDEALARVQQAYAVDPLSLDSRSEALWIYYFSGRSSETVDQAKKTIEMQPEAGLPYAMLALAQAKLGEREEAAASAEKAVRYTDSPSVIATAATARAMIHQRQEALKLIHQALVLGEERYVCRFIVAGAYCELGEDEKALDSLDQAYLQRST